LSRAFLASDIRAALPIVAATFAGKTMLGRSEPEGTAVAEAARCGISDFFASANATRLIAPLWRKFHDYRHFFWSPGVAAIGHATEMQHYV